MSKSLSVYLFGFVMLEVLPVIGTPLGKAELYRLVFRFMLGLGAQAVGEALYDALMQR